ncbi:putative T7SS-secreted protein [Streptomyces sp. NPDC006798]|uniref:putative T7SS-secreted protein n=1 Tax=Streptomyces sp. NPDC006798 TaxID=3155462 RepID=UPI003407E7C0
MVDLGDLANRGLGKLEDGFDAGKKALGEGVDWTTDRLGDGLDYVGAEGVADDVEDWGDSVASELGASVREQSLDETDQADELIHGSPGTIRASAGHLDDFQAAFDNVGGGMKALGSQGWRGEAADAFRGKFEMHPAEWLKAADSFGAASRALRRYADSVTWAQGQARQAAELYKAGRRRSREAARAHNANIDAYRARMATGGDPGPPPPPFSDPGSAERRHARELLAEVRRQRDTVAAEAADAVRAATRYAPAEPPPLDRALANLNDLHTAVNIEAAHVGGGIVKGTADMLNFARGLNPLDIYNITHPAEYRENLNLTAAGIISTVAHPERIPGALLAPFKDDFSEGAGRLVPEMLGGKGLGAGRKGARLGDEDPDSAPDAEKEQEKKSTNPDGWWEYLARRTETVSEPAIHADSVSPENARKFLEDRYPWLKDVNNTDQPGYTQNCTFNVVTVDRRLDGIDVSAAPRAEAGPIPFKELGVTKDAFKDVQSYDDIIRDLNQRGDGSRSVVCIVRPDGSGHVFNAVKTPDGVAFLDGQTGTLATLERNTTRISHVPYR